MSRLAAASLFALLPLTVAAQASTEGVDLNAHPELREIHGASQLVSWCRDEAQARAVAQGHDIYQWSASHSERGNTLSVVGRLRVSGGDLAVTCRIARGARLQFASIEMQPAAN